MVTRAELGLSTGLTHTSGFRRVPAYLTAASSPAADDWWRRGALPCMGAAQSTALVSQSHAAAVLGTGAAWGLTQHG